MNNIDNFIAEFPEVINWEIRVGKKRRGRWRTPVRIQLNVNEDFWKTYNPVLPKWHRIPFFKGTLYQETECNQMSCDSCRKDFFQKLGFVLYKYENPTETETNKTCNILIKSNNNYAVEFFLEWKPGVPDYSKEIGILTEMIKSLEREVLYSLSQAYSSMELEEIKITRQTEKIEEIEETKNNKTKRKINIA